MSTGTENPAERLNLEPLKRAIESLKRGISLAIDTPEDELHRDGVIQRFEYTVDICWKLIQRYLKVIAQVDESEIRTKKDLFRVANQLKLIESAEAWIAYYEARNDTSHNYDPVAALEVFEQSRVFVADAEKLLEVFNEAH